MTQETGGMTIMKLQEKPLTRHIRQTELKITRNADSGHTPRLQTTGNCLSGKIFRCKITSYGDFRNGLAWSGGKCLEKCNVQFGGRYLKTKISN